MSKKLSARSDDYKLRRSFTPASISASQTAKKTGMRARKGLMSQKLTYQMLIDAQARQVSQGILNENTAANRLSALNNFLAANCLAPTDVVGQEMRVRHADAVDRLTRAKESDGCP